MKEGRVCNRTGALYLALVSSACASGWADGISQPRSPPPKTHWTKIRQLKVNHVKVTVTLSGYNNLGCMWDKERVENMENVYFLIYFCPLFSCFHELASCFCFCCSGKTCRLSYIMSDSRTYQMKFRVYCIVLFLQSSTPAYGNLQRCFCFVNLS